MVIILILLLIYKIIKHVDIIQTLDLIIKQYNYYKKNENNFILPKKKHDFNIEIKRSHYMLMPKILEVLNSDLDSDKIASLSQWAASGLFSEREKSCLRFTEEFIVDVSQIPDSSAFAVRDHLGEEGFVNFVNALLVIEQRIRLQLVWRKIRNEVSV